MCVKCVETEATEERFKAEWETFTATLLKEREAISNDGADGSDAGIVQQNEQSHPTPNHHQDAAVEVVKNNENTTEHQTGRGVAENAPAKPICKFYARSECKYGRRGANCPYKHPKICYKYENNGTNRGGCNKADCKFFHPKLCWKSIENRWCGRTFCKFYHLKGTKFASEQNDENEEFEPDRQVHQNTGSRTTNEEEEQRPRSFASVVAPQRQRQEDNNFLGMKMDIQILQQQMTQMLQVLQGQKLQHQAQPVCCQPRANPQGTAFVH